MQTLKLHLPKNRIQIAFTRYHIGLSYSRKGDYQAAIKCFEQLLDIQKKNKIADNNNIEEEKKLPNGFEKDGMFNAKEYFYDCLITTDVL